MEVGGGVRQRWTANREARRHDVFTGIYPYSQGTVAVDVRGDELIPLNPAHPLSSNPKTAVANHEALRPRYNPGNYSWYILDRRNNMAPIEGISGRALRGLTV